MSVQRNALPVIGILLVIILSIDATIFKLQEQPSNEKVLLGQPAVLKCRINIPLNIVRIKLQWSKDMFGLENSTIQDVFKGRIIIPGSIDSGNYDLHFKTTEPGDEALYACHIEITFKDKNIENVESIIGKGSLKVIEVPSRLDFEFQMDNKTSNAFIWQPTQSAIWGVQGQKLKLACVSTGGNPIPQLSWKIDTNANNDNSNRLNINEINLSPETHNSNISCYIDNRIDYLKASLPRAKLSIRVLYFQNVLITRSNGQMDQDIHIGESVSFQCSSMGTEEAIVYYSWFIEYSNSEKDKPEDLVKKSSSNTITLKTLAKHHQSRLHCLLQSSIQKPGCDISMNKYCTLQLTQEVASPQLLNVLYPPKIKTPFENITVSNIGEWIVLSCDVESNPPASVKWFKTQLGTSRQARSINWYFQTSISNLIDLLTIDNIISSMAYHKFQIVSSNDLDIYICEASSTGHPKVYKYVVVAKEEEPTIKITQPIIKVERDGTASLMCLVESWPRPAISDIKWYHESSELQVFSSDRRYFINKRQLMGVESKFFFKKVLSSDFGVYTCTISDGTRIISKQIQLIASGGKFTVYIAIAILGSVITFVVIIALICVFRRNICNQKKKSPKMNYEQYSAPLQPMMLPSPTIDSSIDNEIFANRLNSLPGYPKDSIMNDSLLLPSNRCFVFHNQQNAASKRSSCGDSHNGQDDKSTKKGNESNRSWDSGMGTDEAVYRNGQTFQNPRGSNCISPFSTLNSSNNSIGPVNQNNFNNRFWQAYQPIELINQQNPDTTSSFISSSSDNQMPLIATSANQSFVCIPIEEYHQHLRILQESQGPPSLRSFSVASYPTNSGNTALHVNYRMHNGNVSPTEVSVKSNSTNSKA